ncbi:hypothetical protein BC826DRAFT_562999 [Russula brevipes]|nr:hypothetical protein BC826DRAFT_562999 [Russula brevipes]
MQLDHRFQQIGAMKALKRKEGSEDVKRCDGLPRTGTSSFPFPSSRSNERGEGLAQRTLSVPPQPHGITGCFEFEGYCSSRESEAIKRQTTSRSKQSTRSQRSAPSLGPQIKNIVSSVRRGCLANGSWRTTRNPRICWPSPFHPIPPHSTSFHSYSE